MNTENIPPWHSHLVLREIAGKTNENPDHHMAFYTLKALEKAERVMETHAARMAYRLPNINGTTCDSETPPSTDLTTRKVVPICIREANRRILRLKSSRLPIMPWEDRTFDTWRPSPYDVVPTGSRAHIDSSKPWQDFQAMYAAVQKSYEGSGHGGIRDLAVMLDKALNVTKPIRKIVCFGLGHMAVENDVKPYTCHMLVSLLANLLAQRNGGDLYTTIYAPLPQTDQYAAGAFDNFMSTPPWETYYPNRTQNPPVRMWLFAIGYLSRALKAIDNETLVIILEPDIPIRDVLGDITDDSRRVPAAILCPNLRQSWPEIGEFEYPLLAHKVRWTNWYVQQFEQAQYFGLPHDAQFGMYFYFRPHYPDICMGEKPLRQMQDPEPRRDSVDQAMYGEGIFFN